MKIRTQLKAGQCPHLVCNNHNEALRVRTALKAGGSCPPFVCENHNEALRVRTALKAGGVQPNHSEALQVRTALKAGGCDACGGNHNETLRREAESRAISMRRELRTTAPKEDRLELLVIRAGLRAGARARYVRRHRV